jgi:hypothetical protein
MHNKLIMNSSQPESSESSSVRVGSGSGYVDVGPGSFHVLTFKLGSSSNISQNPTRLDPCGALVGVENL